MNKTANDIYHSLKKFCSKVEIRQAVKDGMIAKENLITDKLYEGHCRNATTARWTGTEFEYMRFKFDSVYPECAYHPEDDDGYDIFVPIKGVDESTD